MTDEDVGGLGWSTPLSAWSRGAQRLAVWCECVGWVDTACASWAGQAKAG